MAQAWKRPRKILVVEDCQSDVFLLEHMLDEAGADGQIEITSVPRLLDAFQRAGNETFDVILLDLNLLDMDGIASITALHAEVPGTPIIVYSGTENRRVRDAALMCGARSYLVKGHENGQSLRWAINRAAESYPESYGSIS